MSSSPAQSKLFEPLKIANGNITLKHRVVFAPCTRNRGTPLNPNSTKENPNRIWVPNDLMTEYYSQRATDGGLIISEGVPPSLEVNPTDYDDRLSPKTAVCANSTSHKGKWYARRTGIIHTRASRGVEKDYVCSARQGRLYLCAIVARRSGQCTTDDG